MSTQITEIQAKAIVKNYNGKLPKLYEITYLIAPKPQQSYTLANHADSEYYILKTLEETV